MERGVKETVSPALPHDTPSVENATRELEPKTTNVPLTYAVIVGAPPIEIARDVQLMPSVDEYTVLEVFVQYTKVPPPAEIPY
jgi:hypothetical protein